MSLEKSDDQHWHLSKTVPITLIISMVILLATTLITYGESKQELKELKEDVAETITVKEVEQKLKSRDVQIVAITVQTAEIKESVKDNHRLLIEILKTMPKEPQ